MEYSIPLDDEDVQLLSLIKLRRLAAVRYYAISVAAVLIFASLTYLLQLLFNVEYLIYNNGHPTNVSFVLLVIAVIVLCYFAHTLFFASKRWTSINSILERGEKRICKGVLQTIRYSKSKLIYCFNDGTELSVAVPTIVQKTFTDDELTKKITNVDFFQGQLVHLNYAELDEKVNLLLKAVYPNLQYVEVSELPSKNDIHVLRVDKIISNGGLIFPNILLLSLFVAFPLIQNRPVPIFTFLLYAGFINLPILFAYVASKISKLSFPVKTRVVGVVTEIVNTHVPIGRNGYVGTWYRINNKLYESKGNYDIPVGTIVEYNSVLKTITLK